MVSLKLRWENKIVASGSSFLVTTTTFQRAIDKLSRHHIRHIKAYDPHEGKDNERYGFSIQVLVRGGRVGPLRHY